MDKTFADDERKDHERKHEDHERKHEEQGTSEGSASSQDLSPAQAVQQHATPATVAKVNQSRKADLVTTLLARKCYSNERIKL